MIPHRRDIGSIASVGLLLNCPKVLYCNRQQATFQCGSRWTCKMGSCQHRNPREMFLREESPGSGTHWGGWTSPTHHQPPVGAGATVEPSKQEVVGPQLDAAYHTVK